MQDLIARAENIARRLKDRGETIVVAESSTGGLISAALKACMLATRSAPPVSSVVDRSIGPATAMQVWPAGSP